MKNQHIMYGMMVYLCLLLAIYAGVAAGAWIGAIWLVNAAIWTWGWIADYVRNGRTR